MGAARKLATYDDVLAAPEGMTAEILGGELHLSPRPAFRHQRAAGDLFANVYQSFGRTRGGGGPGGWWFLMEPELHLARPDGQLVVAVPDIAGWRRSRVPDTLDVAASTIAPDWACEVISPGARAVRRDRIVKPDEYARCGIQHLWIVEPIARSLEVYRLHDGLYVRAQAFEGDVCVRAEPFDAVELDLGGWWLEGGEE